jgi:hypothetical protein
MEKRRGVLSIKEVPEVAQSAEPLLLATFDRMKDLKDLEFDIRVLKNLPRGIASDESKIKANFIIAKEGYFKALEEAKSEFSKLALGNPIDDEGFVKLKKLRRIGLVLKSFYALANKKGEMPAKTKNFLRNLGKANDQLASKLSKQIRTASEMKKYQKKLEGADPGYDKSLTDLEISQKDLKNNVLDKLEVASNIFFSAIFGDYGYKYISMEDFHEARRSIRLISDFLWVSTAQGLDIEDEENKALQILFGTLYGLSSMMGGHRDKVLRKKSIKQKKRLLKRKLCLTLCLCNNLSC